MSPDLQPALGCGPIIPRFEGQRPLRQQVFERIRAAGRIPRAELARELDISPASVTALTADLISAGMIEETTREADGAQGRARGRPRVALAVRPDAHLVVGIKLSVHKHTAVLVDFAGRLIAAETLPRTPGAMAPGALLDATARLLERVCAKACVRPADLSAVGLGVPGFVDAETGTVYWSPVLDRRNIALAQEAERRLGLPVHVDNDANLVTMAELWFGAGRALSHFAVVTIEHGVGMGYVLNHRIHRGFRGVAMELGHTKVQLDGALCRCGQRGCLEAYVADYALAREASAALDWTHHDMRSISVMLESLHDQAEAGNTAARSIFLRAGRYLALGLANVVNLFDPELIILSGERMRYEYLYANETLAEMPDFCVATGRPAPKVQIQAWGDLLWAHGAAALALSAISETLMSPKAA
ncbi:xylose operon repressor [Frigidibacter albus]|nr:xylose operon repressor [Frigidibacter albus]